MASLIGIVDSGPLHAAADLDDEDHDAVVGIRERGELHLVIPTMAVTSRQAGRMPR